MAQAILHKPHWVMPPRKKPRLPPKTSLQDVRALLEDFAEQPSHGNVYKDLVDSVNIHTPHGQLLRTVKLTLDDGSEFTWVVCNPFALVHLLCEEQPEYVRLLMDCLPCQDGCRHSSLVIYIDETTPGNSNRHDTVNEVQCIYWLISQLPAWFRQRTKGWFYFGFLRTDVQHAIKGGLSALTKTVMRLFFHPLGFHQWC